MKTKIFSCTCGCSVLKITKFENDPEVYFTTYKQSTKYSWKYKLQYIWNILKNGHPYDDEIVLTKSDAKEIIKFLKD